MTEIALPDARDRLALSVTDIRKLDQVEVPIQHYFADGVYARHGFVRKGTVFAGRVHLKRQINIISQGDVTLLNEHGVVRLVGPCIWESPPMAQRAAYANEDTIWTTIIGTDETDPQVIFDTCTRETFDEAQDALDELMNIVKG